MEKPIGRRLPNSAHEAGPWQIKAIVPDFTLEDAWALPVAGGADDFPALVELFAASDPTQAESLPTRFLWALRDRLGALFNLGRISTPNAGEAGPPIPGTEETSLAGRLPGQLRGTAANVEFAALPFVPLYLTPTEFAAEIGNQTMHGVMHLAWAERGEDAYQCQMAVYVKPRGQLGRAYMAAIKPFRHLIVYPALMRQSERTWLAARGAGG